MDKIHNQLDNLANTMNVMFHMDVDEGENVWVRHMRTSSDVTVKGNDNDDVHG